MIASFGLSFTRYNLLSPPTFNGIDNYIRMWEDPRLHKSLRGHLPVRLRLGAAAARPRPAARDPARQAACAGLAFYRSAFYLPSLLGASVAIAILWRQLFGVDGLVNQFLALFGIEGQGWISNPDTALGTLMVLNVWTFGSPMVIFLAGLRQIPTMYYEAASVDGASRLQQLWRITLPMLTPIIFFNLILQVIGIVPVVHAGVHRLGRHGRTRRLDALLHAVPVPAGLRQPQHGLRLGHGLAAAGDRRAF